MKIQSSLKSAFKSTNTVRLVLYIYLFFSLSCSNDKDRKGIEFALVQAGDNREELEYVLDYYGKSPGDSLKLQAAKLLIVNMPYYYALEGSSLDNFKRGFINTIDSGYQGKEALDITERKVGFPDLSRLTPVRDIEIVKAQYIIDNIEHSFKVWREQPWGKYISFGDFCEYILPYRIENEPLENWKQRYYDRYQPVLDSLLKNDNVLDACKIIYDHIVEDPWSFILEMPEPHLGADFLFNRRIGSCRDRCDLAIYAMRSLGIPVGTDMVLHSPDQANRHFWSFVLDNKGKTVEFTLWEEPPIPDLKTELEKKRGKVYRSDFSYKKESLELYKAEKNIPGLLSKMNLRDVSDQYFKSNEIGFTGKEINRLPRGILYLCVFDINGWYPVGWGRVSNGTLKLHDVEDNVLFTLCSLTDIILQPVYYPFVIGKDNSKRYFTPSANKETVHLKRKYTMKFMEQHMKRFRGGRFEGANDIHFTDPVTLYTIDSIDLPQFYAVKPDTNAPLRYIRYYSPDHSLCNMAELSFYDKEGNELNGTIIGSDGAIFNEERLMKQAVFDKDPLTFFNAPDTTGMWVGLDFGDKKEVGTIVFLPRNDDNFIREGEIYEVLYFAESGWESMGTRIGTDSQVLVYENVPKNALYWLRNHTKGKEERPFSYEDHKQVWW